MTLPEERRDLERPRLLHAVGTRGWGAGTARAGCVRPSEVQGPCLPLPLLLSVTW